LLSTARFKLTARNFRMREVFGAAIMAPVLFLESAANGPSRLPPSALACRKVWNGCEVCFGRISLSELIRSRPARFFGTIGFHGPDRAVNRLDRKPT
jgi:hypothetical protein